MQRVLMISALLCLLVLTSCAPGSFGGRNSGAGVFVSVLNIHELSDLYFPYVGLPQVIPGVPTSPQNLLDRAAVDSRLTGSGDYVELTRFSTLVHNAGYADSIVAMYVTGYDPNLFVVEPLGPYYTQYGARRCLMQQIHIGGGKYSAQALCAAGEEVLIGAGIEGSSGIDAVQAGIYDANVGSFLDGIISDISNDEVTFFQDVGLFQDLDATCRYDTDGDPSVDNNYGNVQSNIDVNSKVACSIDWGLGNYFSRNSRGSFALAAYAGQVRNCKNGCVVVPARNLPEKYIPGDTENFPGGGAQYVDFGVYLDRTRWPASLNDHEQLFQISACYLYTTYATPSVCIDPTPGTNNGEVCRAGVIDINQPQPAPVRITRIDQASQGPRVMFTIHVENVLGGTVFDPGSIDFCAPGSPESYARQLRDTAVVMYAGVLGSIETLDCRDGVIRFRDGKGQFTCFYDVPPNAYNRGAYQTALNIEIAYLYRDIQTVYTSIHRI